MSDGSTGQGAAETAEPAHGRAPSGVGPGDDAKWLGAFLLAHRGKTFRLDGGSPRGAGPASATGALVASDEIVPTDVIDDVVRAVRQSSVGAPERHLAPERLIG